jgi:hypothetical protein
MGYQYFSLINVSINIDRVAIWAPFLHLRQVLYIFCYESFETYPVQTDTKEDPKCYLREHAQLETQCGVTLTTNLRRLIQLTL